MRRTLLLPAFALLLPALAFAQFEPTTKPSADDARRALAVEEAKGWDQKNRTDFDGDPNYLLKPGLLADKKNQIVTLKAVATGLQGTEPVEFFLIGPNSSKTYEALALSFAKPSDVYAGLVFLGINPGRPINYARFFFYPKGERIKVTFKWEETSPDGNVSERSARVEELLVLRNTKQPLAPTGLTFVGGQWLQPQVAGGEKQFYADLGDPGSIASNYNDSTTVLDLPQLARQSDVYQSRIINPDYRLLPNQRITVTLEPLSPLRQNATDIVLSVDKNAQPGDDLKALKFTATNKGKAIFENAGVEEMVAGFTRLVADSEPFVTVQPAPEMSLKTVKQMYVLLEALQTEKGIRIEPPAAAGGGLFHEAFSPDENFRDSKKRPWQPVEIHLGDKVFVRDFEDKAGDGSMEVKETPAGSVEELKKLMSERAEQRKPIAVYAPAGMRYRELMKWLGPALPEDSVVWVYLE